MKSQEYWNKRYEAVIQAQHRKADKYVANQLLKEYERARRSIQKEIDSFYARFAENNQIHLSDARKLLSTDELKDFKMGVEEFTAFAQNNPDGRWTQKLNNASYKVRVSRLEALQLQIEGEIQRINLAQNQQMTNLLSDGYKDTYYQSIYEIQKGIGVGTSFAKLDDSQVVKIVQTPWLEQNYSERIWGDNSRLVRQLETEITQAFISGHDSKGTARIIADRMGVGYRNAKRLVETEMSHVANEASFKSYRESGVVQKYEFLATLDGKTSERCREMDTKVFRLAEKDVGVNFPPLHPYCRSTTVPYFDDEIDLGERIAREADGKTYNVPGNMSYNEWKEKYVDDKIVLRGNYSPQYAKKLKDTYKQLRNEGFTTTEHALNRLQGHFNNGRISSLDAVVETLNDGKTYYDKDGGLIKYGNNLSIHFSKNTGAIKSIVPRKKPKPEWSES